MSAVVMSFLDPVRIDRLARLRAWVARIGEPAIATFGFIGGLAWAFVGSFLLGLGSVPEPRPSLAWAWLGGEVLIGAATFAGLLLAPAARRGPDGDGREQGR